MPHACFQLHTSQPSASCKNITSPSNAISQNPRFFYAALRKRQLSHILHARWKDDFLQPLASIPCHIADFFQFFSQFHMSQRTASIKRLLFDFLQIPSKLDFPENLTALKYLLLQHTQFWRQLCANQLHTVLKSAFSDAFQIVWKCYVVLLFGL